MMLMCKMISIFLSHFLQEKPAAVDRMASQGQEGDSCNVDHQPSSDSGKKSGKKPKENLRVRLFPQPFFNKILKEKWFLF